MKQDTSTSSPNQQLLKAELDAIAERIPSVPARNLWPWLQQVLRGNKDTIISLILAILPNLKELRIHVNHYNQLETTMALIGSIVTAGDQFQTLPKLYTLSLLMTFMALPGLQDVTISKAISRKLSPWPYGSRSSNVVHILLHDVAITGESLKMLLSRCKALKSFGYTPCHPNELGLLSLASGIDLSRKAALKAITRSARQCSNCILRGEYRVKSNRTSQQGA